MYQVRFDCTQEPATYKVPPTVTSLRLEVNGAAGGAQIDDLLITSAFPGKGVKINATLQVKEGDILTIDVGCQGGNGYNPFVPFPPPDPLGGYGAQFGGDGGEAFPPNSYPPGAGGGGSSRVKYNNSELIAGGGGGAAGYGYTSGDAGFLKGSDAGGRVGGKGGTQSNGGQGGFPNGENGTSTKGGKGGNASSTIGGTGGGGGGGGCLSGGGGAGAGFLPGVLPRWDSGPGGGGASCIQDPFKLSRFVDGEIDGNGSIIITPFRVVTILSESCAKPDTPIVDMVVVDGLRHFRNTIARFKVFTTCQKPSDPIFVSEVTVESPSVKSLPFTVQEEGTYYWTVEIIQEGERIVFVDCGDESQILHIIQKKAGFLFSSSSFSS